MKTCIIFLFILIFSLACGNANIGNGYMYKVMTYGYKYGERDVSSSKVDEECEVDSDGQLVFIRDGEYLTRFKYDDKANLISKTQYQVGEDWKGEFYDGQIIRRENYEYDNNARINRRLVYSEAGTLIAVNNLKYYGDSLVVEEGFGTDLSDGLVYQAVTSKIDNSASKSYSDHNYWVLTRKRSGRPVRIVLSKQPLDSDNQVIEYTYDHTGRLAEKKIRSGFTQSREPNPIIKGDLSWRNFKVVEPETKAEFKVPGITESWELLTMTCLGKVLQSDSYVYNDIDSTTMHITDFEDAKIIRKYSYPDKFTEIREYSGSPFRSSNGKSIHTFDKSLRPKSIEVFDDMGEPIKFKEFVYSKR